MNNEIIIRVGSFLAVFILIALWEIVARRRPLRTPKKARWFSNLGITLIDALLVRLVFPVLAVNVAIKAQQSGWGFLNNFDLPFWLNFVIGIVALDLTIYLQHLMFHAIPILWRLHMMHHADLDYDLTTGLRFHPLEMILSMGIKMLVVVALGPPAGAVLIFEILLNGLALFNHGNIKLPVKIDQVVRYMIVTPDMHRVHHSVIISEANSNYGFNLPWWDRLFGTYCDQPVNGHDGMTIGLSQFRDPTKLTLPRLLILPFIGDPGNQPINRH